MEKVTVTELTHKQQINRGEDKEAAVLKGQTISNLEMSQTFWSSINREQHRVSAAVAANRKHNKPWPPFKKGNFTIPKIPSVQEAKVYSCLKLFL